MQALRIRHRHRRGAWLAASAVALALSLPAATPARAADCLARLALNGKWSCDARLSNGQSVHYCLNVVDRIGTMDSRAFDMATTGPFRRTCTCGAKGKGAASLFDAASSYLCSDPSTDTSEVGTITKKRIVGQTFNASVNVRSAFICTPDPDCGVEFP
jgi:hypothetical protein